ncbi:MAG: response regulator [Chloroflexi bacterium]|nr:MAG: response regulator [Chloroflexota bacterium]
MLSPKGRCGTGMFGNEPIPPLNGPDPCGGPFASRRWVVKMQNTVLVVEDDPSLLMMLSVTLRSSGHTVVLSSDAELALETLPEESPDVILCDVNLPGMKGTEFTEIVKAAPHLADTPVVLMSAYDEPRNHAADAFVSKPFDPIEVTELVEELASRK